MPKRPTIDGAMIPPMLATELISAIPAAAATPPRKSGGSAQKTGNTAIIPAWATHNPASFVHGSPPCQAKYQPTAAAVSDPAMSVDRDRLRSEIRLTTTIATTERMLGSVVRSPTFQKVPSLVARSGSKESLTSLGR